MPRYSGQFEPRFSALHDDEDLMWVVPFRVQYILGVCGYRFVGKSEAITYLLEKRDFQAYSISTTLRRLANQFGVAGDRRGALQDFGDDLRQRYGAGYLAVQTLRQIRRDHLSHHYEGHIPARIVVGGFKRPEELQVFRSIREFAAIAITAKSDEIRWRRAQERGLLAYDLGLPAGTEVSYGDFQEQVDKRDRFGVPGDELYGQAVEAVVAAIGDDDRVANDEDLPALLRGVEKKVSELDKQYRRPRG
jgi:hypothetical protein